ncbi:N-acetyltransferase family protein [Parvibaculum sp. MBR-TMA-1.3b-4.2]
MSIREATIEDSPALAALFIAARARMPYLNPGLHNREETRAFIYNVVSEQTVLLAENGGILGFAAMESGWLHHLYVDPARQNAAAGSLLMDAAKKFMPQGFSLWVFQANLGARRFYRRHGCRLVKATDGAENEEKLPDMLLRWPGHKNEN